MGLVLLLGVGTIGVGLCARATERSWVAPSALFALLWGAYLTACAAFVSDPEPLVRAGLWVMCACAVTYAGALFGRLLDRGAVQPLRTSQVPRFPALRQI